MQFTLAGEVRSAFGPKPESMQLDRKLEFC
jgi:hypothetical protein